jgi:long-chain acyl-CoA synthetase
MSPLIAVAEHIAQARQLNDGSPTLPWSSFGDFFKSRVYDRRLVNRPAGGDPFIKKYDRGHEVAVE